MGVYTNIQTALDTKLNEIDGSPAIAWPNTNYEPQAGTLYLRPHMLNAPQALFTLNDYHRYEGIYQIDINVPPEKGTSTLNLWLDRIVDHFLSEKELRAGGDTILIQNINIGPRMIADDDKRHGLAYYMTPVDINFIVYS